ncbi:MAG: hypothetical protein A2Z02_04945 [Chloroflexi bacterium RBG_16_48_7]|nr:MAG: hypothetical protein A2Z02_04945 [Chloroflexi bacterium RBG_16_48_7]
MALTLAMLIFIAGMARQCMPVLFKEIAAELNLDLVAIGVVWGVDPLAGIFVAIPGGLLIDRIGVKRTMAGVCILCGVFGALRGFAGGFGTMAFYMFLFGLAASLVMSLSPKVTAMWFSGRYLGLTNALIWIALYVGQMIGAMFSATYFSPWLGGWREVLFVIGIPAVLIGILWVMVKMPNKHEEESFQSEARGFRETLLHVVRIRDVWLIAIIFMTQMGVLNATNGYIPLFLRNMGWNGVAADGAFTLSLGMGCIGTIPLVMLSNRLRARKLFLFLGILMLSVGIGSLMFVRDAGVWVVLSVTGLIRAVGPVILNMLLIETKGIGSQYAGTAFGVMTGCGLLAAFILPPVGNSLATINPGLPFVFWGAVGVLCLISLRFLGRPQRSVSA